MGDRTPTIETARLRLRGHRADDLAARAALVTDPETMRFIGGLPQSGEENWARIQRYAGHWALLGWGLFAVEERAGGRMIGEVGLARFERGLGPDFDAAPEAAWILAADHAGRGLAHEAASAAVAWHEQAFGPRRLVCIIAPDNHRSLRLAARLGFLAYREALYHDRPVILHERTPPLPTAAEAR